MIFYHPQIFDIVENKATKRWTLYKNNVMAADIHSAKELINFLKRVFEKKLYVPVLEVMEIDKDDLFIFSKN